MVNSSLILKVAFSNEQWFFFVFFGAKGPQKNSQQQVRTFRLLLSVLLLAVWCLLCCNQYNWCETEVKAGTPTLLANLLTWRR